MGYYRAGFDIVGVDIKPMPRYPFEFHQADALEYCMEHGHEFDVIHASPPCQAYTGLRHLTLARYGKAPHHPDLINLVRRSLLETNKTFIIENVQFSPLATQFILCGAAFGLSHLARHRHFESNFMFMNVPLCKHKSNEYTIGVYGNKPDGRRVSQTRYRLSRVARSLEEAQKEMEIDWMTWDEIREAVPPAYTEWIGKQLLNLPPSPSLSSRVDSCTRTLREGAR